MKAATQLIHVGEGINHDAAPLTTPIYETTTFVFENAAEVRDYNEGRSTKFLYSRYENPTVLAVERRIAALEGAARALLLSSGQAATATALLALLAGGDEVVCSAAIYGGTLHLIGDVLPKFGVHPRFVSIDELRQPDALICRRRPRWSGSSRQSTPRFAASTSRPWPRRAARGAWCRSWTTRSPVPSISSRWRSASTS